VARRLIFVYGMFVAVLTGLYFTMPGWHLVTWSGFGVLSFLGIVAGVRVHRPRRALPWLLWAVGTACFATGTVTALVLSEVLHQSAFPSLADVIFLAGCAPCLLGSLITLTRSKATAVDRASVIDALILTTGAGFLSWVLVVHPYLSSPFLTPLQKAISVAYPILDVLILAILVRFMLGVARSWSASLLLLSGAGLFVADVMFGLTQLEGFWKLGSPVDLGWILFYVSSGAAALLPSMRQLTEPRVIRAGEADAQRLVLGTASLIAPAVLLAQALTGRVRDGVVIAVVSAVLVALAMSRMSYVAAGLRRILVRERELRRACELLLSATDTETVTTVVHGAIARLLPPGTDHCVMLLLPDDDRDADSGAPATAVIVEDTGNLPPEIADQLGGHELTLHCTLSVGDRHAGQLYVAADEKALVDLQQAIPVLAGQAGSMIDHIALNQEINRRDSEMYFRTLVLNAGDVILIVDDDGRLRYGSPSASGLFGTDDLTGTALADLFTPGQRNDVARTIDEVRADAKIDAAADWAVLGPGGEPAEVEVSIRNLRHEPSVNGIVLTLRDVTDRRRLQRELEERAYLDPLTGLGSRLRFQDDVERAAEADTVTGVLLIDIDEFRTVNEAYGSHAADDLLRAVGNRLSGCLEGEVDASVARLGADEFGVVVEGARDAAQIDRLVDRVMARFTEPFVLHGSTLTVQLSIGIATTVDASDHGQLLSQAGAALRNAKSTGKGRWRRYEAALHREIIDQAQLRAELEHAISTDQLVLHFQPIIELESGRTDGFESLVRWQHPEKGLLPPIAFIELAEESGLIVPLGDWVLEHSLREAATWQERFPADPPHVSVNVSARQFRSPDFVDHVLALVDQFGLAPHLLTVEITESLTLAEPERVRAELSVLCNAGVRVSIDDFGTGYSSLSYLHQVPADILKLDKSFVDTMSISPRQYDLVHGIVQLARTLRLDVVAEGIETPADRALLTMTGCRFGQGYLISRPMPGPDVVPWLTANLATSVPA
jgi:diguanylate cyclase (GGDEF)-like protein/PAS domain S-box-containing protein